MAKRKKQQVYLLRAAIGVLVLLLAALGTWLSGGNPLEVLFPQEVESAPQSQALQTDGGLLQVWYLDVGQADSIYIQLPDGKNLLIDAGEKENGAEVVDFLRARGVRSLDYLIATHPHADHIGGMREVVQNVTVKAVYMPPADTTTSTYEKLLTAIADAGLTIQDAKAGVTLLEEGDLHAAFLAPVTVNDQTTLNNASAVLKLTYGTTSFLFMGDAETESEQEITGDVCADVVKVGHHGSNSSSGKKFVSRVQAKIAVISVGKDNDYGHPSADVVERWTQSGATVWRTDESGTVLVQSDGKTCAASAWKENN